MKKPVKVARFVRDDGTVVEEHTKYITVHEDDSLTDQIKKRKQEQGKREALANIMEERQ